MIDQHQGPSELLVMCWDFWISKYIYGFVLAVRTALSEEEQAKEGVTGRWSCRHSLSSVSHTWDISMVVLSVLVQNLYANWTTTAVWIFHFHLTSLLNFYSLLRKCDITVCAKYRLLQWEDFAFGYHSYIHIIIWLRPYSTLLNDLRLYTETNDQLLNI